MKSMKKSQNFGNTFHTSFAELKTIAEGMVGWPSTEFWDAIACLESMASQYEARLAMADEDYADQTYDSNVIIPLHSSVDYRREGFVYDFPTVGNLAQSPWRGVHACP